ncbi:MAG: hypothetical protein ACR2N1_15915 [Rubripirellula sp.]
MVLQPWLGVSDQILFYDDRAEHGSHARDCLDFPMKSSLSDLIAVWLSATTTLDRPVISEAPASAGLKENSSGIAIGAGC